MQMGVMNATMVFSMKMNQVLGDLEFVVIYIDDIAIFSETLEDHIIHIREVLKRLKDSNIKINIDKCNWISTKIKMLGHYISETGIEMDKSKIEAIVKKRRQLP